MEKILITTTNGIQDAKITNYLGIVSANVVVGTNIFSDFVASLSDVFGGTSGTYQNQLAKLYSYAIDEITEKALKKRANAVIGLHVDFDELSGKGKSMFMVSIVGTAVALDLDAPTSSNISVQDDTILLGDIQLKVFMNRWAKREVTQYPSDEEWDFIFSHDLPSIAESMYQTYLFAYPQKDMYDSASKFVKSADNYFAQLDYDTLCEVVYKHFNEEPKIGLKFVEKYYLFNASKINELLHSDSWKMAVLLLSSEKSAYSKEDLTIMEGMVSFIESLPDNGRMETKGGLLSSSKIKYVCNCGCVNDSDTEYCADCGLNRKGLSRGQVKSVNIFKERTEALSEILSES